MSDLNSDNGTPVLKLLRCNEHPGQGEDKGPMAGGEKPPQ